MSDRRRQLALLVALVVTFALLIGRELVPGLGGGGPRLAVRSAGAGQALALAAGEIDIPALRVDALEHKPASYTPGRDPFRFAPAPAPPPPPPPRPDPDAARRAAAAQAAARQRAATPAAPPRPQPPAVEFVFLGSFGLPGRVIAVFSDGKEIVNAFEGDVLQSEFVVRRIGYESADIGFVNFPDAPAKRLAVGG